MVDIFISYSKQDRDKAAMLATYLESEGWSVWWDKNLTPGDTFRDEIMKQLAMARAVIVVWTPTAVKSDFVRAEAGRAQADHKLIPVKDDVSYGDIPLPFGEMHTEDLSNRELVRAAVVAQLVKPRMAATEGALLGATLRYEMLSCVGIAGGVLTLFANLDGVIRMAKWASYIVNEWSRWVAYSWRVFFGWLPFELTTSVRFQLTMCVSIVAMAWGSRLSSSHDQPPVGLSNVLRLNVALAVLIYLAQALALNHVDLPYEMHISLFYGLYLLSLMVGMLHWPWYVSITASALALSISEMFQKAALRIDPANTGNVEHSLYLGAVASVCAGVAVLLLAHPRRFFVRMCILVVGVITLLVLNEISKMDLSILLAPPSNAI